MSLGIKIVQAVQKEAAMQRPLPLQATAEHKLRGAGRATASVTLTDNDRFSHMANDVTVAITGHPAKHRSPQVVAESFTARATYLTEALRFVECDATGAALVRSTPETMRAPRTAYFEAKIGPATLSLQRFQPRPDTPGRDAIPFCVTDEVLARLVEDAAAVLAPRK
jgi:hypothetical protein